MPQNFFILYVQCNHFYQTTELYNYQHNPIMEYFHPSKNKLHEYLQPPPFPIPIPENHKFTFCLYSYPDLEQKSTL